MNKKIAIITGSSSGIGLSIAYKMAENSYNIVLNSRTKNQSVVEFLEKYPKSMYLSADIASSDAAAKLVSNTIENYGRLDVLVNNAGATSVIPHADIAAVTKEVWGKILETNIVGTWSMINESVPHLEKTKGNIINISSRAASRLIGSSIPYAVSKAGVEHMTRFLAKVLGPEIRVNALAPGLIETSWTQEGEYFEKIKNLYQTSAPLQRIGYPEDVAEAVILLLNSNFITGAIVPVDGGASLL